MGNSPVQRRYGKASYPRSSFPILAARAASRLGGLSGVVRLWNIQGNREIWGIALKGVGIDDVAFDPD